VTSNHIIFIPRFVKVATYVQKFKQKGTQNRMIWRAYHFCFFEGKVS